MFQRSPLRKLAALVAGPVTLTAALAVAPTPAVAADEVHVYNGQSIAAAIDRAGDGGRVVVHAGEYPKLEMRDRSWSTPVYVRVAYGDLGKVAVGGVSLTDVSGLKLRGLSLTAPAVVDGGSWVWLADSRLVGVIVRDGATDVSVVRNEIAGGYNGIAVVSWNGAPRPTRVRIAENHIHGQVNDNVQVGIADDVVIEDNVLRDTAANSNHNDGVQFMGGERLVVRRNRFSGQDQAILLKAEASLGTGNRVGGARIENNLVHHTRGAGIILAGSTGTQIVNNTVYDTPLASLHLEGANQSLAVWNNVLAQIWKAKGATAPAREDYNCVGRGGRGAHDVVLDPGLVDHTLYRLVPTSPCVDLGDPVGAPTHDLDLASRHDRPDAGALEAA